MISRSESGDLEPTDDVARLEREVGQLAAELDALRRELADRSAALAAAHDLIGTAAEEARSRHLVELAELRRALDQARAAAARSEAAEQELQRLAASKLVRWSRLPRRVYAKARRARFSR